MPEKIILNILKKVLVQVTICDDKLNKLDTTWSIFQILILVFHKQLQVIVVSCDRYNGVNRLQIRLLSNNIMRKSLSFEQSNRYVDKSW